MELREFFSNVGGDYDEVMSRLGKEERVVKYLLRFIESDPIADFDKALKENNIEECFRNLHSIKGMCLNLGLGNLEKSSSQLCEEYRNGVPQRDVTDMISRTHKDYDDTVEAIKALSNVEKA